MVITDTQIDVILNTENDQIKVLAAQYPFLTNSQLLEAVQMRILASLLYCLPQSLMNTQIFKDFIGPSFETNILRYPFPYLDFDQTETDRENDYTDQLLEDYAKTNNLKRQGFYPQSPKAITGWTIETISEEIDKIRAEMASIGLPSDDLKDVMTFAFGPNGTENNRQAMTLYNDVLIPEATSKLIARFSSLLEQVVENLPREKFVELALRLSSTIKIPYDAATKAIQSIETLFEQRLTDLSDTGLIFQRS